LKPLCLSATVVHVYDGALAELLPIFQFWTPVMVVSLESVKLGNSDFVC